MGEPEKHEATGERMPDGRFAPGVCPNPHGRPKAGQAIAEMVREKLSQEGPGGRTYKELLVEEWLLHALGQAEQSNAMLKSTAWKMLAEYDSGKPVQRVEGSVEGIASLDKARVLEIYAELKKQEKP